MPQQSLLPYGVRRRLHPRPPLRPFQRSPWALQSPNTANNDATSPSDGAWTLVGAFYTPLTDAGSGLGASVSLTSTTMVLDAPYPMGNGVVFVYNQEGAAAGMEFGAAVDLSSTLLMVVGVPRAQAPSTLTKFGAV